MREDRWLRFSPTERIVYERTLKEMQRDVEAYQKSRHWLGSRGGTNLTRHFTQLRQVGLFTGWGNLIRQYIGKQGAAGGLQGNGHSIAPT